MKTTPFARISAGLLLACVLTASAVHGQIYPAPTGTTVLTQAPYNSTGVLITNIGTAWYRGSASVANDPRLLYSCAHVYYENGVWATKSLFARGWYSSAQPAESAMTAVRGWRYYSTYSGGATADQFALDFTVGYKSATTSFGPALPCLIDGTASLQSASVTKMVLGYPATIDFNKTSGGYFLHRTGPFTNRLSPVSGSYHFVNGVSTGPGNSGGPVLAANAAGTYSLAAILVSGSTTGMGVHGLTAASDAMANNALAFVTGTPVPTVTKSAANTSAILLPDASATYTTRTLALSGLPASATNVKFSINITTTFQGDLDVYLRSPTGRVQWVQTHDSKNSAKNLVLSQKDYTATYAGYNPNGNWDVFVRDFYRADRATFNSASLTATAR